MSIHTPPTIDTHSFTAAGAHGPNEDACLIARHPSDADTAIVALADGQGGRSGGQRAAQLAVHLAVSEACRAPMFSLSKGGNWPAMLERVDAAIAAEADAGFTTLIAFAINCGRITGASSGDSALLLACPDGATTLTANQHRNPPVGSGGAPFIAFGAVLPRGWQAVVMSDGVWKYAGWDELTEQAVRLRGEALIQSLADAANLPQSRGWQDDFTVAVFSEHVD